MVSQQTHGKYTVFLSFSSYRNGVIAEKMTFEVIDQSASLLRVEMYSKKGVAAFLGCFDVGKWRVIEILKFLKDNEDIIKVSGKIGNPEDQLKEKPEGEDEKDALAAHFIHFESDWVWRFIRDTGFHELLPN